MELWAEDSLHLNCRLAASLHILSQPLSTFLLVAHLRFLRRRGRNPRTSSQTTARLQSSPVLQASFPPVSSSALRWGLPHH